MGNVIIYTLSDPQSLQIRYVGVTKRVLSKRIREHVRDAKNGIKTHRCNWIRQILQSNKYPFIEIVDQVNECEWEFWEQYWISQFKQWGLSLVNKTIGGGGTLGNKGWKHTTESKERIRKSNSGVNNYNYGKSLSKEWKKKISASLTGKSNPFFGKKHTEETLMKKYCPVLQYTLEGVFVKEWKSIKSAIDGTSIKDISFACSGKIHSAGGFQWRKKNGIPDKEISAAKPYKKPVAQIDIRTGEIVKMWDSIRQAEQALNLSHIGKVCSGYKSHKTIGGYKWKFL